MAETAFSSYTVVSAPEMHEHGPFNSEGEVAEFVRDYAADHGERSARTELAAYGRRRNTEINDLIPLDRFL